MKICSNLLEKIFKIVSRKLNIYILIVNYLFVKGENSRQDTVSYPNSETTTKFNSLFHMLI